MYFRLKISESSGPANYSDIAAVHFDAQKRVVVNPTPIQNKTFSLTLQALPKRDYSIHILNTFGRSSLIKSVSHSGGNSTHQIRLDAGLAAGNYIISVSSGTKKYTAQLIVL
nr:hypothetical protein [uncultured organism]